MRILFLLLLVAAAAAITRPAVASPTHYDLTVDIRPNSHAIAVKGLWTIPAEDLTKDSKGAHILSFVSSEKLRQFSLSLAGRAIPLKCGPFEGQLKCVGALSGTRQSQYILALSYVSDGVPVSQLRIDADQAFAGSSGDYWYPQLNSSQRDTGLLRFDAPSTFRVIAPGKLIRQWSHDGETSYEYRIDRPVAFGFAAAPFQIYSKGICSLYLQHHELKAQAMLAACASTAAALASVWGPFPGGRIALVEVSFKGPLLGVSESGYILADSSQMRDFDVTYWAHEFSHQWWGNLVHARDGTGGRTLLTEGMAEFGALSVIGMTGGVEGKKRYLWGDGAHSLDGAPLRDYLGVLSRHQDLALSGTFSGGDSTLLHYIATSKGAIAIDMLANEVGRPLFRTLCARFLKEHAGESTSWTDFESFVRENSGNDLRWFYREWFDRTGLPLLYATWAKAGGGIDVTVHQCGPSYRLDGFPLAIRISSASTETRTVELRGNFTGRISTAHLKNVQGAYRVTPDPDHEFLWLPGLCE